MNDSDKDDRLDDLAELVITGMMPKHPGYPIMPAMVARALVNPKWTLKISYPDDKRFDVYVHHTDMKSSLHDATHREEVITDEDGVDIREVPIGTKQERNVRRIAMLTSAWVALKRIHPDLWYVDYPCEESSTNRAVGEWRVDSVLRLLEKMGFDSIGVIEELQEVKGWVE